MEQWEKDYLDMIERYRMSELSKVEAEKAERRQRVIEGIGLFSFVAVFLPTLFLVSFNLGFILSS